MRRFGIAEYNSDGDLFIALESVNLKDLNQEANIYITLIKSVTITQTFSYLLKKM